MPTFSLEREIVGIDLSHNYLRVVQLTNNKNDWSITRLATAFYGDKQANEDEKYHELVGLLKEIKKQQNFDTDNAAISLPINDAIVQIVQIPYLEDELLNTAVQNGSLWQNAISLPGDLSEYSIFWQVIRSDADAGTMSLLFVASSLSKVDQLCKVVRDAGFNPVFVDVRCFALRNISKLYDNESQETSVYLEISGYENYMVGIYKDMPFIYDIFVTDADVSALIANDGEVDAAAYARISSQVIETIAMFSKQIGKDAIKEINLVSSLGNLECIHLGLSSTLGEYLLKDINPFEELKVSSKIKSQLSTETNLSVFAVALGLATRRLDLLNKTLIKAVANINLLPNRQDLIEKETKSSNSQIQSARIASYFLVLTTLFLVIYVVMATTLPSEADVNELGASNQALQVKVDKLKADLKDYNFWFNQVEVKNRQLMDLGILDEIPTGVYVLDFKQGREGLSEVALQSSNPSLISAIMDKMGKKYKNVKLISVETDAENIFQISKITFEIK
jgi:type IV pilus assembly protein PilN